MAETSRPNILLITTDQQRFDTLHAAGNPYIRTPHLNWLMDEGVYFSNCYSDAPLCIPTRATIMSGRCGYRNNLTLNSGEVRPINPEISLPGLLTRSGYQTRAEGKMHFVPRRKNYGFEHMELLEDYYRYMAKHPHLGVPADHGMGQNEMEPAINTVEESNSLTHWIVDRSVEFLRTRDESRPFFLWTSFSKPHPPYDPCRSYWQLYQNAEVPPPVYGDWSRDLSDIPAGFMIDTYVLNGIDRFDERLVRDSRRAYYACITQIDYNIGRLYAHLLQMGLLENTMIIFASDHGDMLGDHHMGAKTVFLEGSAHVPMIVRPAPIMAERNMKGSRCDSLVQTVDIYTTCLDAAEVTPPKEYETDSLDLLSQAKGREQRETFYGVCGDHYAVIEGGMKYTYCAHEGAELLFDMRKDPYEQHNLLTADDHRQPQESDGAESGPNTRNGPESGKQRDQGAPKAALKAKLENRLQSVWPEKLENGKLPVKEKPDLNSYRGKWPGFHPREHPEDVMH